MTVMCVAGRFATALAMATLRKHALAGTRGFLFIVVSLMNYRTERSVFFWFSYL